MARRISLALVAGVVAAALAAPAQAATKLVGTVGTNDAFVITLKTASGKKVTKLKAGTYTIVVRDRSGIHNFHLKGPGINKVATSVSFIGTKTITVRLRAGKYSYFCDPHHAVMHGAFTVT